MKIPIKKYVMDESLSWEDRYKQLEKHHLEETEFLIQEIEKLELVAKGCCCEDGTMDKSFDMSDPNIAGFSKEKDREFPFPIVGAGVCDKCHGANVMRSLNERQKERIRILQLQLDNAREEREKIAQLLNDRRETK